MRAMLMSALVFLAATNANARSPIAVSVLAEQAVSDDADRREAAIANLRALGQAGLDALWSEHRALFERDSDASGVPLPPHSPPRRRAKAALDAVAGQYDAYAARLFWHTDFDEAKRQAAAQGKAILSLRLLGELSSDLSCANSRFFRTALYPDPRVNALLRERFVLHWRSVADVPLITIDMGDGRVIQRTVVGNSIHYVLDADGHVIDGLPGLYGPGRFARLLEEAADLHRALGELSADEKIASLAQWHERRAAVLADRWTRQLAALDVPDAVTVVNAAAANDRTASKRAVAAPVLDALDVKALRDLTTLAHWEAMSERFLDESRVDDASIALMREKNRGAAREASLLAVSKTDVEDPMLRVVRNLEQAIAQDTARNEFQLHQSLHRWLAEATEPVAVAGLNERVYAELFLMPLDDPWLGLAPGDAYAALDGGGLIVADQTP